MNVDITMQAKPANQGTHTRRLFSVVCGGEQHYVVTSGAFPFGSGPETYVFRSDSDGEVTEWGELPGSFKGSVDHERAIEGYRRHLETEG